jgi:predicted AlkP superfamily phosphohydrolase/phosphomutase
VAPQRPQRIVLLSLDGFGAERHRENLAHGVYSDPDGVAAFAGGYVVERAIPVNPTLTAVSHTSIGSGAFPAVTGIVSNTFHRPGAPIVQSISGFDAPSGAEPLWEAFGRQGKRVGVLTFPGCDDTVPSRTADFGMVYVNTPFARSRELELIAERFAPAALPPGWTSFSPARGATFTVDLTGPGVPATVGFTLTALDSTDDGRVDYDTLVVDDDADPANGTLARVRAGEWFPLRFRVPHRDGGTRVVGAWCLLQTLPADLSSVRIYRGGFYSTEAYPREFREELDKRAGFWPGAPDDRAEARHEAGEEGITPADLLAQVRRLSDFFNACARTAISSERFDLLMLYQPIPDEVEHVFLLTDVRQRAYSAARAASAREMVTESFRVGDRAVGELARSLDLSRDALIVVSDHGMAPVWEDVYLNQLLQHAGLAAGEKIENRWRVEPSSKMVAYANGGCAHLYVNLKGRDRDGVVEPDAKDAVVRAAAVALAQAQVDGEDVVEAMFRHGELAQTGLESPIAGDLVVFLRPGFAATSAIGAPGTSWHGPSEICGQHGYLNSHPEVAAVWLARGAGVPQRRVREESLTEVASFVATLAGLQPPLQARPWRP